MVAGYGLWGSTDSWVLLCSLELDFLVLETLSKNCGENVFQQIVEQDVLHEMVKVVKKKSDLNVREKILIMKDTWQEALEGTRGRFPRYHAAYNALKNRQAAGVKLPLPEENSVSLFTLPKTHPVVHPASAYEEAAVQASLQSDPSGLSLPEIQNAEGHTEVLTEILAALDLNNPQGVKDEVIIDLFEQCRSYQKRVMILVNNTADEDLLCKGLALNDDLLRVLTQHDDIAKGTPMVLVATRQTPVAHLMNVNHEDDESEDEFAQLAHRSSRDTPQRQGPKPVVVKSEPKPISRVFPPPSSRKPTSVNSGTVDLLQKLQMTKLLLQANLPTNFLRLLGMLHPSAPIHLHLQGIIKDNSFSSKRILMAAFPLTQVVE